MIATKTMSRLCFFKCLQNSHPAIALPHDVEVSVGRSKLTKIRDQNCSRQQLSLKADCNEGIVELKQIGVNPSGLDGFAMIKDSLYKVEHGTKVEILLNNYIHLIEFDPPPEGCEKPKASSKRKLEDEEGDHHRKKKHLKPDNQIMDTPVMEAAESSWDEIDRGDVYVYTSKGVKPSSKIAAFDMDGTLIKTKSGKVHPVDFNDWQIAFPPVPQKLKEQIDKGYKIVILSNQAAIGNGKVRIADFKKKIENLIDKLHIPIQAYISTGKGFYRKPMTGMWHLLSEKKNDGITIDMNESFYCGDAAGRVANWAPGKKKDHSMADKLFAENLGLKFYTPEQFFLGHSIANVPMSKPEFDPKGVISEPFREELIGKEKEVIVLVGYPGSGKSFLAKQIEKKCDNRYATVCRDILGSWQKCASETKRLLQEGKSVIVDSTNPDTESRGRWTALARELGVRCRCVKMATTFAHARHNNKFRELMKTNHLPVNDIVFHTYKNKFVEPKVSEGFDEVLEVKFSPDFQDSQDEKKYRMYLLEK